MGTTGFSPLDAAIAKFEGFGTPAAPSITAGNNPGAVQVGSLTAPWSTGVNPNGTSSFGSLDDGLTALHNVEQHILGVGVQTPASFVTAYEGGIAQPAYAASIASDLGIGVNDPIPATATGSATAPAQGNAPFVFDPNQTYDPFPPGGPLKGLTTPKSLGGAVQKAAGDAGLIPAWLANLTLAQIAAFVIGAGLIIGGIFFLRSVQSAVVQTVSTAKKGAALIA